MIRAAPDAPAVPEPSRQDVPLRIGPVTLATPFVLAPLAGITTPAFRLLCEEQGAGLTFTEMISAPGLVRGSEQVAALVAPSSPDHPFAVQLAGAEASELAEAARRVAAQGAVLIDINMGCPANKVAKTGGGVALMRTPERAETLLRAVCDAVPQGVGVTVKMRLGWDDASRNAPELAARLVAAGAAAVTVHGRTGRQGFRGRCDLEGIRQVVTAVDGAAPVLGNGDVRSPGDARRMLAETGCHGVMVGRGALGNPWLFAQLRSAFEGRPGPQAPTASERIALMERHLALALARATERKAVAEARHHLAWTCKGIRGAAAFRQTLQACRTAAEVRAALGALRQAASSSPSGRPAASRTERSATE